MNRKAALLAIAMLGSGLLSLTGQRSGELSDRGPRPCDDDGLSHDHNLRVSTGKLPVGNNILWANYRRCP